MLIRKARIGGGRGQPGTRLAPMRRAMFQRLLAPTLLLLTTACADADADARIPRNAPPAAAVVAPGMETATLADQLAELNNELQRALDGEPQRLLPAEAITDRLIDAERSADWLASGYDVEARLRQLQAMADRVVSLLRRGATVESVEEQVTTMQRATEDLQRQLAATGGGAAPPPLDSLLAQDPLQDVQSASLRRAVTVRDSVRDTGEPTPDVGRRIQPGRTGPLGTPVDPPDTIPDR